MAKLLLIDDDDTTREVLTVLLSVDGWTVTDAAGGNAAISIAGNLKPDVVLSDLQMPGICGAELARALRSVCGERVVLIAMTATRLQDAPEGYDVLLVKPFTADAVRSALSRTEHWNGSKSGDDAVLSMTVFENMKKTMAPEQLRALYHFAMDDAERRIRAMEANTDDDAVRKDAHALKGSFGMLGAERLRALSAFMERNGRVHTSEKIAEFREEIAELRRMLERL